MDGTSAVEVPKAYVILTLPFQKAPKISVETLKRWQHLSDIKLSEAENKEITILVGSDILEAHWVNEQRIGQSKEPYAVRSLLGWTIRGPLNVNASDVGMVRHPKNYTYFELFIIYNFVNLNFIIFAPFWPSYLEFTLSANPNLNPP